MENQDYLKLEAVFPENQEEYDELVAQWTEVLRNSWGKQGPNFENYWAQRLALLGYPDEVSIQMDDPEEPNSITIEITPDYGS